MEKVIRFIVLSFVFLLLISIFIVVNLPENRMTDLEKVEIKSLAKELNEDLPRNIGTIGTMNKVSLEDRAIVYTMSVYEDPNIIDFYKEHYSDFKEVLMYSLVLLNGRQNNGSRFGKFLAYKEWGLKVKIIVSDGRNLSWYIEGKEIEDFFKRYKQTPTSALRKVIQMQIEMAKLNLPMSNEAKSDLQSVISNTLISTTDKGIVLKDIKYIDDTIIFEFNLDENNINFNISDLEQVSQNQEGKELIAISLVKDADIREFFNLMVISHSNLTIKYHSINSNKTTDINLPYIILKKYCSVPQNILID